MLIWGVGGGVMTPHSRKDVDPPSRRKVEFIGSWGRPVSTMWPKSPSVCVCLIDSGRAVHAGPTHRFQQRRVWDSHLPVIQRVTAALGSSVFPDASFFSLSPSAPESGHLPFCFAWLRWRRRVGGRRWDCGGEPVLPGRQMYLNNIPAIVRRFHLTLFVLFKHAQDPFTHTNKRPFLFSYLPVLSLSLSGIYKEYVSLFCPHST